MKSQYIFLIITYPADQENLLSAIYEQGLNGVHGAEALQRAFVDTNNDLRKMRSAYSCGSTATTVILHGDKVLCANAGDSPAFVVSRSGENSSLRIQVLFYGLSCSLLPEGVMCHFIPPGEAFPLTVDHNPNTNEGEKRRVEACGGRIEKMNWQVLALCSNNSEFYIF